MRRGIVTSLCLLALLLFSCSKDINGNDDGPWVFANGMREGRHSTISAVVDGRLYVLGGFDQDGRMVTTVEAYDPATNRWSFRAPREGRHTDNGSVCGVIDGRLYVAGAKYANDPSALAVDVYDPSDDSWGFRAYMPSRRGDACGGVIDGLLYLVGGSDGQYEPLATVEAYDPLANSWSTRSPMPNPRWGACAAAADGKLYVAGGRDSDGYVDVLDIYDPVTDTWLTVAGLPDTAGVDDTRLSAVAYMGTFRLIGEGLHLAFDPIAQSWGQRPRMDAWRKAPALGVIGNSILAAGGASSLASDRVYATRILEIYTPLELYAPE